MEFFKIAWRSMGRNLRRTLIITCAIALGIWGALMAIAIDNSFVYQMVDNFIYANLGHIQIHRAGYSKNPSLRLAITDANQITARVKDAPHLAGFTPRIIAFALAQSPRASQGVMLLGIDPGLEPEVTRIKKFIIRGSYFGDEDEAAVLVGKSLAEKLNVDVGDKLAFFTQSFQGREDVAESLRVRGIYSSGISEIDKAMVYLPLKHAERIMEMQGRINEIAILADSEKNVDLVKAELKQRLAGLAPELRFEPGGSGNPALLRFLPSQPGRLISAPEAVTESFKLNPKVSAISIRLLLPVSAQSGAGRPLELKLYGVEAVNEDRVSGIFGRVEIPEGSWLAGAEMDKELEANQGWVILGRAAAASLEARPGDKVSFSYNGKALELEVAGVLDKGPAEDGPEFFAVADREQTWRALLPESSAGELAVVLRPDADPAETGQELAAGLALEVKDWKELWPILAQMTDMMEIANWVLLICIYIVIAFGIANTMIMSVFERVREFGILRAVGTMPAQLFGMVIIESILLAFSGMALGGAASAATYWLWARNGLDLSMFAAGLSAWGIPAVLYPVLTLNNILSAVIMAFLIAVLSALYPAFRASRLLVVEALRRF